MFLFIQYLCLVYFKQILYIYFTTIFKNQMDWDIENFWARNVHSFCLQLPVFSRYWGRAALRRHVSYCCRETWVSDVNTRHPTPPWGSLPPSTPDVWAPPRVKQPREPSQHLELSSALRGDREHFQSHPEPSRASSEALASVYNPSASALLLMPRVTNIWVLAMPVSSASSHPANSLLPLTLFRVASVSVGFPAALGTSHILHRPCCVPDLVVCRIACSSQLFHWPLLDWLPTRFIEI